MFSVAVKAVMEKKKLVTAPSRIAVCEAAKLMARRKVGAIVVVDDARLVGIFTERDALVRVIAKGKDPTTTTLAQVMTPSPKTIEADKSFGLASVVMHENGFRHLPVTDHGQLVGIISARDALDPDLEEFTLESQRRQQILRERD